MHRIRILKKQFKEIQNKAEKLAALNGREVCGLLLDNGSFLELIQVKNKSKRGGAFSFYSGEIAAICKKASLVGHRIVGTFHSHPIGLPVPGASDLQNALDDELMLIFDVMDRSARLWLVKNQKSKARCFSLII